MVIKCLHLLPIMIKITHRLLGSRLKSGSMMFKISGTRTSGGPRTPVQIQVILRISIGRNELKDFDVSYNE